MILRRPFLTEVVGHAFWPLWYTGVKGKILAPFMVLGTWLVVRYSDYSVYITERYLQKLYPGRRMFAGLTNVTVTSQLVDQLGSVKECRETRSTLLLNKLIPVRIGMLAGLDIWYKGHDILLKAVSELQKMVDGREVIVDFVGSGESKRVKGLADALGLECVAFKGPMPNDDVLSWMSDIDIYVQPSRTEAHGRAVLEAMSKGCIVVSSDVGGMKETVREDCRFPSEDAKRLSLILLRLIQDERSRAECISHSVCVARKFSERTVERERRRVMDMFYSLEEPR
jgi:glycosyltransferase involved in cell wall biosynthesis